MNAKLTEISLISFTAPFKKCSSITSIKSSYCIKAKGITKFTKNSSRLSNIEKISSRQYCNLLKCFSQRPASNSGAEGAGESSSEDFDLLRSPSGSPTNRRKHYRKSRKRRSTPSPIIPPGEDEDTATDLEFRPNSIRFRRRRAAHHSASPYKGRTLKSGLTPPPLKRAQSSPSQLVIKDADLLQKVKDTLVACSTPIRLEDRRKYAPLTPAGHDRPKLLASANGLISVEPTFRKTLSQGSLVKGNNINLFGHAEGMMAATSQKSKIVNSSPFKRDFEKLLKQQNEIGEDSF